MILDYEYFQLESMDVFNFFAQIYLKKKKKRVILLKLTQLSNSQCVYKELIMESGGE